MIRPRRYQLTYDDAIQVWLRHWAGEYQDRIAASYDVNQGRVNEVLKGHRHPGSKETALRRKGAA